MSDRDERDARPHHAESTRSAAIHHHWVPQSYLRRWSTDDRSLYACRLLVSHESVPLWERRSISNLAARSHLYTTVSNPSSPDLVETWLNEVVEQPAFDAIERVVSGRKLNEAQWTRLIRFAMALHVRSPVNYLETMDRLDREVPDLLASVLRKLPRRLHDASRSGRAVRVRLTEGNPIRLPLSVTIAPTDQEGMSAVSAELVIGRETWLHQMHHVLTETAKRVLRSGQQWSIARPFGDSAWFTSDDPVVRLNYYGPGKTPEYDLKGGWLNRGTDIMLPLSPTHMLYAQIGTRAADELPLDRRMTFLFQRALAENAFREVYAYQPYRRVLWFRERSVDIAQYTAEAEAWSNFHAEQTDAISPPASPMDEERPSK